MNKIIKVVLGEKVRFLKIEGDYSLMFHFNKLFNSVEFLIGISFTLILMTLTFLIISIILSTYSNFFLKALLGGVIVYNIFLVYKLMQYSNLMCDENDKK